MQNIPGAVVILRDQAEESDCTSGYIYPIGAECKIQGSKLDGIEM